MMVSAPVDSNLLNASNWTVSNTLLMKDYIANVGWLEGNAVVAPDGSMKNILRVAGMSEKAAVIQVSSNGATQTFSPQTIIDFPGGASKFTIRYDAASGRYWALVNKQANPTAVRNRLVLTSSTDLVNWTTVATILQDANSAAIGFQYADWQFDGSDIIFVSRTAFGGSGYFHDAEYLTFHRISKFRLLSQTTTNTINASEDAEIDGHANWRGDTKGIPHSEWGWDASELRVRIYDPIDYPGADASHALIKWNFSSISATDIVTAATLEMSGWDGSDGPIDVYGIELGAWSESTVTWNSWATTTQNLVLLGQLACVGPANTAGQTTFSDPDLTAWVQDWVSGSQSNYGLILKMHDDGTPGGDSFSSREDTWSYGHAPQLVIQHVPASVFTTLTGKVTPSGYMGNLQNMGVQIEFRQNGVLVQTERTLLDATGGFSIGLVPKGTYTVAVKAFGYLQKVVTNVNVSADPTDIGTVVLKAGDLNGDSVINLRDFAIMASNWLFADEL